jgi:hypothetical protein
MGIQSAYSIYISLEGMLKHFFLHAMSFGLIQHWNFKLLTYISFSSRKGLIEVVLLGFSAGFVLCDMDVMERGKKSTKILREKLQQTEIFFFKIPDFRNKN